MLVTMFTVLNTGSIIAWDIAANCERLRVVSLTDDDVHVELADTTQSAIRATHMALSDNTLFCTYGKHIKHIAFPFPARHSKTN